MSLFCCCCDWPRSFWAQLLPQENAVLYPVTFEQRIRLIQSVILYNWINTLDHKGTWESNLLGQVNTVVESTNPVKLSPFQTLHSRKPREDPGEDLAANSGSCFNKH